MRFLHSLAEETYLNESVLAEFEKRFSFSDPHEAVKYLESNFRVNTGKKKKIEITCPGPDPPLVQISDDMDETLENDELVFDLDEDKLESPLDDKVDNCFHISIKGKNFDLSLDLNC